jgi:Ca2+-binding EF-hand superfamily protein
MKLFSLKTNPAIKQPDVKNAFRMLCKDYGEKDNMIHRSRIKEILEEIGLDAAEITALVGQLDQDLTKDGFLNFEDFVDRQFV